MKKSIETKRFNMNIPIELYNDLKKESDLLGVNITALILFKLKQLQEQYKLIDAFPALLEEIKKNNDNK